MSTDLRARLDDLFAHCRAGRIMDAMRTFYHDDVVMSEPAYGDTVGLAANLEREQRFVDSVREFRRFDVIASAVGDGVTMYENVMEWVDVNGTEIRVEQVAVQTWRDGRIIRERFYYATG